jgi:hypothetical protein
MGDGLGSVGGIVARTLEIAAYGLGEQAGREREEDCAGEYKRAECAKCHRV